MEVENLTEGNSMEQLLVEESGVLKNGGFD